MTSRSLITTLADVNCYPGGTTLTFSPDGATLANVTPERTITLWQVAARKAGPTLSSPGYGIYSVTFSPDGSLVASGNDDGTVTLWDAATRKAAALLRGRHSAIMRSVAFSADGTKVAAGGAELVTWAIQR
jgi:WD40 repeat protein